jgi:hypothetical protein
MEYKVEAASHLRRKFIEAILPSMIEQVGLTNSRKVLLVRVEDCGPNNSGTTINLDPLDAYVVCIKPQSLREIASTLAHEMVHVKQLAKGQLKPLGHKGHNWCGTHYPKKTKYYDMPWEIQAFAKQELIMRRAVEGDNYEKRRSV